MPWPSLDAVKSFSCFQTSRSAESSYRGVLLKRFEAEETMSLLTPRVSDRLGRKEQGLIIKQPARMLNGGRLPDPGQSIPNVYLCPKAAPLQWVPLCNSLIHRLPVAWRPGRNFQAFVAVADKTIYASEQLARPGQSLFRAQYAR